jgi:hypothetical protein
MVVRTRESSPYRFQGDGPSLVADAWHATVDRDPDAQARLQRFRSWTSDVAGRLDLDLVSTTSASELVPPGYRQVGLLAADADRPLVAAAEREPIADATPFVVPRVDTDTVDDHDEGQSPTPGDLDTDSVLVEPKGAVGRLELTRQLVDGASPSGDRVALAALREDYAQKIEQRVYEAIEAAQTGTITNGFVPSGVQVSTSSGDALPVDLRRALARYAIVRGRRPRNVVAGGVAAEVLAEHLDETSGTERSMWNVLGAGVNPGVAGFAGATSVTITGRSDLWLFESPMLELRHARKKGPELVEIAVWAYSAAAIVRPSGLAVIRHSA